MFETGGFLVCGLRGYHHILMMFSVLINDLILLFFCINEYTKHVKYSDVFPAYTGRWAGVNLMLALSRRRWAGIGPAVVRCLVIAGKPLCVSSL